MELIKVITVVCIGLSVMLTPCASQKIQIQSYHEQAQDLQLIHTLPRKLKLNEEVITSSGNKDLVPSNKQKEVSSDKLHLTEENKLHSRKGTWREWVEEGTETSQFFTMDYTHVRRRRPIHNKALPVDKLHLTEENKLHSRKGTWREWVEEGTETSQFFTMDYTHVRRRRPIHNKALPVGP
ncbi:unnamed protein product [Ilex paraguariensis]|uniref:Uncharacterized protein n=1 Tax=Ilex paraguariensis TaxID=185542 RepID=A0ABC8RFY7_9AQUA